MKAEFSSSPPPALPRPAPRAPAGGSASGAPAAAAGVQKARASALRPKADPTAERTGGGGALGVRDLSHKPQPSWGADPFSTRLQLEQHRLFNRPEPRSPAAAVRMYEGVSKT